MSSAPLVLHLDHPRAQPPQAEFEVKGWVAARSEITQVRLQRPGETIVMALVDRPDVRAALPDYPFATGFVGFANTHFLDAAGLTFDIVAGGAVLRAPAALPPGLLRPAAAIPPASPVASFDRAPKLARLAPHLACPACRQPVRSHEPACRRCGARWEFGRALDFLTPEERRAIPAPDRTPASHGGYDEVAYEIIRRFPDGLILDCGAGCRDQVYGNVVNLEIMDYPSTDVRATNERLPFADGSFDAVFSFATLEHVRDPFAAAAEIVRVLKPGGLLYSVAPLLAPFHGYPNHYYNMTGEGHKLLYGPAIDVLSEAVPLYGRPIYALTWILNSWSRGLPPAMREKFLDLRVRDLAADPYALLQEDYVRYLDPAVNNELATNTAILGRKR